MSHFVSWLRTETGWRPLLGDFTTYGKSNP
jgi:hypothetical protein